MTSHTQIIASATRASTTGRLWGFILIAGSAAGFGTLAIFALTRYPKNEPELPSSVHIRRALGGPIANGLVSILFFLLLPVWRGNWFWIGMFALFENLFVYTLQIFLPLGFNDGSTILRNLRKK